MPSKAKSTNPGFVFLGVILVAVLFATGLRLILSPNRGGALLLNKPVPPISAVGWLNGPAPTAESLRDKVVVIDAWGSWCIPCRAAAPELVATYNRYRDKGVEFIGLTSEGPESIEEMKGFLRSYNIPWPNGYGAGRTLMAFRVEFIPATFVVDRKGQITWNSDQSGTLDDAIEQALAKSN